MINNIIKELLKHKINVEIEINPINENLIYKINGFYKSGLIQLEEINGELIATARYNEKTDINELRDLVYLNYKWWNLSKERYDGWKNPDQNWISLLEEYNFITKKIETIITYK